MFRLVMLVGLFVMLGCSRGSPPPPSAARTDARPTNREDEQPVATEPATSGPPTLPAPAPTAPPELRAAFAAYTEQGDEPPEFAQALRAAAPALPLVDVTTGDAELRWNSLTINQHKLGFDAIRFRSPLEQPADMHWLFSGPGQIRAWFIQPVNGAIRGFTSFKQEYNVAVPGVGLLPENSTIFQALSGGQILPGEEYVLWFVTTSKEPVPLQLAMRLSAAGTFGDDESVDAIANSLGIERKYQEFAPTPAGMQAAFASARQLMLRNEHKSNAFAAALRSIAGALQPVTASAANHTTWNQVSAGDSLEFAAVRLRTSASDGTRLNLSFVSDGELPRWGVLAVDGETLAVENYRLRANVAAVGHDLPIDSLAVFQSVTGLQPDHDYIVWFAPVQGALPEVLHLLWSADAATALTDDVRDAEDIAAACGWDLPETATSEQLSALFARCRSLWDPDGEWSWETAWLLYGAMPDLPRLTMTDSEVHWNDVAIEDGIGVAAVVLADAPALPASLAYVVAKPAAPLASWFVVTPHTEDAPQIGRYPASEIAFPDIDRHAHPVVQVDVISHGQLRTGSPQLLVFGTRDKAPMNVQIAARWLPQEPALGPLPASARSAAAAIGLQAEAAPAAAGSSVLSAGTAPVQSLLLRSSAGELIGGSTDGAVRIWNPSTGELSETLASTAGAITDLDIDAEGNICAAAHPLTQTVTVWGLTDRKVQHTLEWGEAQPQQVAVSPNGRWVAACDTGFDNRTQNRPSALAVWDLEAPEQPVTDWGWTSNLNCRGIEFDAASQRLFAGGWRRLTDEANGTGIESVLRLHRLTDLNVEREFVERDTSSGWYDLALSPDGARLYGSHLNGELEARDPVSGERLAVTTQPDKRPEVTVSADSRLLATIGVDREIRVWDARSLQLRRLIEQPEVEFQSAVIPGDGATTISGGVDGTLRVWDHAHEGQVPIAGDFSMQDRTNSLGMRLVPIPAGEFEMGAPPPGDGLQSAFPDEQPLHHVRITRPFYMSAHEVTVGQFRQFVDATGYRTLAETSGRGGSHVFTERLEYESRPELNWRTPGFEQTDEHPVVQLAWPDAVAFCEWLSAKEGVLYRLPTEAEWEHACRAGSRMRWSFGEMAAILAVTANVPDSALEQLLPGNSTANSWTDGFATTAPVGSLLPNAFGLYDMHGNVWEYCSDWYDPVYYHYSPEVDPPGATSGEFRVVRGSGYVHWFQYSRSAARGRAKPDETTGDQAFRIVRDWD